MPHDPSSRRWQTFLFLGLFIALVAFRIWLILGVPKYYINAPHDDLYYARVAHYLIHGQWLGPYDAYTLIKAPFYAFFLIFSYFTGLPLLLNETLFYVLACLVLYLALQPVIPARWWRLLLFTLLLFLPAGITSMWALRVYREHVFLSLTLFVLAFSIGLLFRIQGPLRSVWVWSLGLGLSMAAFMLCREEGVWIYPLIFLLLLVCFLAVRRSAKQERFPRLVQVFLPVLLWSIPILVVSALNYSYYGFWGISENLDRDLNRVLNTIYRIKTPDWKPYHPVNEEILSQAYEASPLFAQLKPYFGSFENWIYYSDRTLSVKPDWYLEDYFVPGQELAGSHFLWMFRDVLQAAGYLEGGRFPREYLQQTADQLGSACESGALDCYPVSNIPMVGSIQSRHIPLVIHFLATNFQRLLAYEHTMAAPFTLDISTWRAEEESFRYFDEFTYNPIASEQIGRPITSEQLIAGRVDLRIKALQFKAQVIDLIYSIYMESTQPLVILLLVGWVLFVLVRVVFKTGRLAAPEGWTLALVSGFFLLRMGTLAVMDATTSVPAIHYAASCYIYLYLLIGLSFKALWTGMSGYLPRPPRKDPASSDAQAPG